MKEAVFYLFAFLTLGSAVIVVTTKNILYAAFALMLTLFGIAGLYVFLNADFLAATQVMIYVGGILVLVLFGVMMTSGKLDMKLKMERGQVIPGVIISALILLVLRMVIRKTPWQETNLELPSSTENIGNLLMGKFLLPFEVASILLLVALVGAVLISRREVKEE